MLFLGGDAHSGKIEHGRYFLGEPGGYVEVSQSIYLYMYTHEACAWIAFPMTGLAGIVFALTREHAEVEGKEACRAESHKARQPPA